MPEDWINERYALSDEDHALLPSRKAYSKLGFAVQLTDARTHRRFRDLRSVAVPVLSYVAAQVSVPTSVFGEYLEHARTIEAHRAQIRAYLGLRPCTLKDEEELAAWLSRDCDERGYQALEARALDELRRQDIEPPTEEQLGRVVASAQQTHKERFYDWISATLPEEVRAELDLLLDTASSEDEWETAPLTWIRRDAGRPSLDSMLDEVAKLARVLALGVPSGLLAKVPPDVVQAFRVRVPVMAPAELRRQPDRIRHTLLAAFCWKRRRELTDNVVDLLLQLTHKIGARAERRVVKEILHDVKKVHGKHGLLFSLAAAALEDPEGAVRDVVYPVVGESTLRDLVKEYRSSGPAYRYRIQTIMKASYGSHYRRMLPEALCVLEFRSNNEFHRPVVDAIELLRAHVGERTPYFTPEAVVPVDGIVPASWASAVFKKVGSSTKILRTTYEICVLQALRPRLRSKEIWVAGAERYCNPDEDVPSDFSERREHYYRELGQPSEALVFVGDLKADLERHLRAFNDELPQNDLVRILPGRRAGRVQLTPPGKQAPPRNLRKLKAEISERWASTSLLDVLKETELRLDFTSSLRALTQRQILSTETLRRRLLLAIYGMGTNLGIKRVSAGNHGESERDLGYIRQRYLHPEALRACVRRVTNQILAVRDPVIWGEATTSCASDSKQFATYSQNLTSEWHNRYGGAGVMIYWHVGQRAACFHSQLKRCSSSEVASMIQGVLHHCTDVDIERQYVDTHGQSFVGFAFCYLLGFDLLPRLKDIHRKKLFLPNSDLAAALPHLQPVLGGEVRWALIAQQYDELIKFATALQLGTAEAETILRRFTRDNLRHPTYQALLELGRAVRTLFLCRYFRSLELRREIQRGLNIVEAWNSVNSFIFYGRSEKIGSNNRQDQEVSMLCLHLLQNCLVYINTLMLQDVLAEEGWLKAMSDEDRRALTPLLHAHINPYGSFSLDLSQRISFGSEPKA